MDDVVQEIAERLVDLEYRKEYGAAGLRYDVAIALVEARLSRKLTQSQLAHLAGVSQSYIAKLESGEANPTVGHLGAILAAAWLRLSLRPKPLLAATSIGAGFVASGSEYEDRVLNKPRSPTFGARQGDFMLPLGATGTAAYSA